MNQEAEVVLARGDAAKALLKSDTFQLVTNELVNGYVGGIVNSQPDDVKSRETLYAHVKAVQDIVATLNQWAAMAQQTRMALADAEEAGEE